MLNELRLMAKKRDVPYQSLIKIVLQERIDQELRERGVSWRCGFDRMSSRSYNTNQNKRSITVVQ